jgi:hypothetical protein
LHVTGKHDEIEATEFENYLLKKEHQELQVFNIPPTIEDVFMNMMNE